MTLFLSSGFDLVLANMSIRSIVNEVLRKGILTDAEEEEILSLIKSRKFDEDDASAVDELMEALARGQIERGF